MRPARRLFWLALLLLATGCGGGPNVTMVPVRGAVKFSDGSVPRGELPGMVHFDPAEASVPGVIRKGAYGEIQPDGSFQMTTVTPGDGVIAGKYKVYFTIHKTYMGQESLIPEKYTKPETTPFEQTVERAGEPLEFKLEKR
jgi:hypothetical protein